MKRIFAITLAGLCMQALVGTTAAQAQEGGLNKEVEVDKQYIPDVEKARKLGVTPRMTDTVSLRPEIDYSIRPSVWHSGFGVPAISPVRVDASVFQPTTPYYLKAGLGFPLQSLLDFYGHWDGKNSKGGVYVNHYGQYADIKNDAGIKNDATATANKVGVYGSRDWGRLRLEGEAGYDYRLVSRYAAAPFYRLMTLPELSGLNGDSNFDLPADPARQHYSTPEVRFSFGNDFTDLSRFNFRIGAGAYYMSDRYDMAEKGLNAFGELGRMFGGIHKVTVRGEFDGHWGADSLHYRNRVASLGAKYGIETEKFKFSLGAKYVYDGANGDNWFFPDFKITFDVTNGYFVPFILIDGQLKNNSYRNTSLENPFVVAGLVMPNTAEYNGRAGISGSFSSAFSYKAYAGVSFYRKMNSFVYIDFGRRNGQFYYLTDNATMFTAGAELDGRISGSFDMSLAAHYYGYTIKNLERAGDRPNFDADLSVRYNYRDKFSIRAGATLIGRRYAYASRSLYTGPEIVFDGVEGMAPVQFEPLLEKISPVVDVNIEARYRVSRMVQVFVAGHNLANSKLYLFNHYPSLGINATAGVTLSF